MAHRSAAPERPERWDRERYEYERGRDRYGDTLERFEEDDDHVYVRRGPSHPPPPRERDRDDRSVGPSDAKLERRFRDDEGDVVIRERRRVVYDDEPPPVARRGRPSSPPPPAEFVRRRPASPPPASEVERSRVVIEKERYHSPSPSPVRRPARLVRRQSSLDTFDRKPAKHYWERDELGPPARRDEYRVPPYVDIPLPRSKAPSPPRVYADREYYEDIQVSDPHRYGDDDFHVYPERVREKEIVRTRRRTRSREPKGTRRRGRSRSSNSSSSSSSRGGTTLAARSEYPKKGKTRIPARLVSKRALIDLGYPFVEEGKVIVVQKALGQQNIDDLLKLSDDYKKGELEIIAARSSAGDVIEERVERRTEVYETGAAAVALGPRPIVINSEPGPSPVEVVKTTVVRDVSPARSFTTMSYDTTTSYDTFGATPVIIEGRPRSREVSAHVPVGPVALASGAHHHLRHHHHHRRDSLEADELRSEIRHLERELVRRERSRHRHSHSRHRSRSRSSSRGGLEVVRAERLSTGELVLYEEEVERIREPARGSGVRIEKDKRGRLSISVPRYR